MKTDLQVHVSKIILRDKDANNYEHMKFRGD